MREMNTINRKKKDRKERNTGNCNKKNRKERYTVNKINRKVGRK